MSKLWVGFKAALSAALLAVVGLLLFLFFRRPSEFALLGMASVFLFMAALLWAKLIPGTRELGLVGIVLSFGLFFLSAQTLMVAWEYPRACPGKRIWCELENVLHALGGPVLAAGPPLLLGLVVLLFSARVVRRRLAG